MTHIKTTEFKALYVLGEIVRDFSEEEKNNLTVTELYKIMVDLDEKD